MNAAAKQVAALQAKKDPECVKVVVRCRPMSRKEVEDNRVRIVEMDNKTGEVMVKNPEADPREQSKPFTFDQVYDWNTGQEIVFDTTARPIVDSVLQGYNGTVFAYGQTGTGKTHTMEGQWDPPELRGIIPRTFCHIFDQIEDTHEQNFLVRASYLEIYNEEVRDLLSKDPKNKLELKEDVDRGVYVKDLTSYVVKGVSEMENVLLAGKKNRSVGATLMNQDSSRSHSIFTIIIESSNDHEDGSKHIRAGKLNLVDLAGSERQSKTGATGDRLKEATKINMSLSALGNVISALVDAKSHHVPYRDSKLTRLLQDSLGGNTKTVMVANMGPADYNYDESISTLRYANRAKNIKNKPKINEDPKDAMLREFQEEIAQLKALLESQGGGGDEDDDDDEEEEEEEEAGGGGGGGGGSKPRGGRRMRQMSNKQLDVANEALNQQKQALAEAANMRQEEKEKAEAEIRAREEALHKEKRERERLAAQLKAMEDKMLHGHADADNAKRKEEELVRAQIELEERRAEQEKLAEKMREREDLAQAAEDKYASINEEAQAKTKKLKKLWARYEQAQGDLRDMQKEIGNEKMDLMEAIRDADQNLKLLTLIMTQFVPPEERKKIENRAQWDENLSEWRVVKPSQQGASAKRPVSAITGSKRPSSAVSRAANRLGSENPRFKGENIIQLELDMPERTTRDYEDRDNQEPDMFGSMALHSNPNVFYGFPDQGAFGSDDSSSRPKSRSTTSRPSRPSSARKGARSTGEIGESIGGEADFPVARGMVRR